MSDVIIEGLFVLGAAALGGGLAILGSRSGAEVSTLKEQNSRLQKQVERLLKQVEAYHLLEDLYASDLSKQPPSNVFCERLLWTPTLPFCGRSVDTHSSEDFAAGAASANNRGMTA